MKKWILYPIALCLVAACGGNSKSGAAIAQEICDCSKKANELPVADPNRKKAQDDCLVKQGEAWNKVKDDTEKADAFNKTLSACAAEQIKKSFGQ